jgi:ATP-dependent Clp protease protease subunit
VREQSQRLEDEAGRPPVITRDSDRDRWFDAYEAQDYGLIDDVITHAASLPGGGGTGAA